MSSRRPRVAANVHHGFTMVELAMTLTVLAVLVALAIPSFTSIINTNRLATASNELIGSLQLARMEAVRRNARVVVCASADAEGSSPACDGSSWEQWIIFVDANASDDFGTGDTLLRASVIRTAVVMAASSAISGNSDIVVFRSDGLAYDDTGALLSASVNVCIDTAQPEINSRNVVIAGGSRMNVEKPSVADPGCTAG